MSHGNTLHTPVATECELGVAVQKIAQHKDPPSPFFLHIEKVLLKKRTVTLGKA